MKKALALALLVLMLVVSFLPCADAKARVSTEKSYPVFLKKDKQSNQYQDVCTPFCQCSCCSITSIYETVQTEFPPVIPFQQPYLSTPAIAVVKKPHDIWQPPQL